MSANHLRIDDATVEIDVHGDRATRVRIGGPPNLVDVVPGVNSEVRSKVRAARCHDRDAWSWLFLRAYPGMLVYARRRLRDDAAAADAVSEAMTRAMERIDWFRWRRAGFDGWLFGILRNVVREMHRSHAREVPTVEFDVIDLTSDPASRSIRAETSRALTAAYRALSPAEQVVIDLRVVDELSSDEAGAQLGKRAGAVRMSQARALDHLRVLLAEADR